jgi:hemoglobin
MDIPIEAIHAAARALRAVLAALCLAPGLAAPGAWAAADAVPTATSPENSHPEATPAPPTLFDRIGGEAVLRPVVARVVDRTAADPRSHHHFDGVRLSYLKDSIYKFICRLGGGGCDYDGETMQRTHSHLRIRASEFDALVQVMREELDRAQVPQGPKNELLRKLAPLKRDIVGGAPPDATPAVPR